MLLQEQTPSFQKPIILNVTEKDSVAKSLVDLLHDGREVITRGRGKVFEFDCFIQGNICRMIFMAVNGQVGKMVFEDAKHNNFNGEPLHLYQARVKKIKDPDAEAIVNSLLAEATDSHILILWLDNDREGESISSNVQSFCRNHKTSLVSYRAKFSGISDRDQFSGYEIVKAVQELNFGELDQRLVDAVDARQEFDMKVSYSFSRFQFNLLSNLLRATGIDLDTLNFSTCRIPILGMLVQRACEIQEYVLPKESYGIYGFTHFAQTPIRLEWGWNFLFDEYETWLFHQEFRMNMSTLTVKVVDCPPWKATTRQPPGPMNTKELIERASKYFGRDAYSVLEAAQLLYQEGYISYHRTEALDFPRWFNLKSVVETQRCHPQWGTYAEKLIEKRNWRSPEYGGGDRGYSAHLPIYPTKYSKGEAHWKTIHSELYELVVRQYLAYLSEAATAMETSIGFRVLNNDFDMPVRKITQRNFLEVYTFEAWGDLHLIDVEEGDYFEAPFRWDNFVVKGPELLRETELFELMHKARIGTPATMLDHLLKLIKQGLVERNQYCQFLPTDLGEGFITGYKNMGCDVWKAEHRTQMAGDLDSICEGNKTKAEVLKLWLGKMKWYLTKAKENEQKLYEAVNGALSR